MKDKTALQLGSEEAGSPPALRAAERVLRLEADALAHMADHLPADFGPAVEAILGCSGRLIVSGIGKSGHVGNKIAATLASTGTPAYFVHAAEASHGDLGMITAEDVCVLISNSGETAELVEVLGYTRRFGIPVVGISSRNDSTLMRHADYCLTLPAMPEACPIGMAPTTSTTMTMALGDALAVALMRARGFEAGHFREFHPGRQAGRAAAPRLRTDARGGQPAAGRPRHPDGRRAAGDVGQGVRHRRRGRGGRAAAGHRHRWRFAP